MPPKVGTGWHTLEETWQRDEHQEQPEEQEELRREPGEARPAQAVGLWGMMGERFFTESETFQRCWLEDSWTSSAFWSQRRESIGTVESSCGAG